MNSHTQSVLNFGLQQIPDRHRERFVSTAAKGLMAFTGLVVGLYYLSDLYEESSSGYKDIVKINNNHYKKEKKRKRRAERAEVQELSDSETNIKPPRKKVNKKNENTNEFLKNSAKKTKSLQDPILSDSDEFYETDSS